MPFVKGPSIILNARSQLKTRAPLQALTIFKYRKDLPESFAHEPRI